MILPILLIGEMDIQKAAIPIQKDAIPIQVDLMEVQLFYNLAFSPFGTSKLLLILSLLFLSGSLSTAIIL